MRVITKKGKGENRRKGNAVLIIILGLLLLVGSWNCSVKAASSTSNIGEVYLGPSTTIYFDNYEVDQNSELRLGLTPTVVSCMLSGNTGGITNLYEVYITWSGGNLVQSIKADNIKIGNGSALSETLYFSKSFSITGLSSKAGTKRIGTCYIPKSKKTVYAKSTNLRLSFYDRDYWISTGDFYGPIRL